MFSKYNRALNLKQRYFTNINKHNSYKKNKLNFSFDKNKKIDADFYNQIILETQNFKILFFISLTFTYFGLFMYYVYI